MNSFASGGRKRSPLLIYTILAERILVPLIATPFAEQFEKKVLHHEPKQKTKMLPKSFSFVSMDEFKKDVANGLGK